MLKQNLSQKMIQKLSPQQIQLMKLLQIPTTALEQRIKEELETNPALEEGLSSEEETEADRDISLEQEDEEYREEDTFELNDYLEDYINDDPIIYSKYTSNMPSAEDQERERPLYVEQSYHEYLLQQLAMRKGLSETQKLIARQIIGSIDQDGYLRRSPSAIADDLLFAQNVELKESEILEVLEVVQSFDPIGTGARDLKECLELQLDDLKRNMEQQGHPISEHLHIARLIIKDYFDHFSKKHYERLMSLLNLSEEDLKSALEEILKLNPKPASSFRYGTNDNAMYIIPDFVIINEDGELRLSLNARNAPDLRINDHYKEMLHSYKRRKESKLTTKAESDAIRFIKQKIDSAKWFIDAIKQRQDTMYRTMYAIMQYQYDYFLTGDEKNLKPMILKDIAELTNRDLSTISRVANSKYVQTEFGTKCLKEFFSESMVTEDGSEVSTLEVKKMLKELIDEENKKKPLSDEKIKALLKEKGYSIARRTVAKYREQLGIPVARLRKEL